MVEKGCENWLASFWDLKLKIQVPRPAMSWIVGCDRWIDVTTTIGMRGKCYSLCFIRSLGSALYKSLRLISVAETTASSHEDAAVVSESRSLALQVQLPIKRFAVKDGSESFHLSSLDL